jgi:hypothetical protein
LSVCECVRLHKEVLYRDGAESLSCIDCGGGGGCLNETIFGLWTSACNNNQWIQLLHGIPVFSPCVIELLLMPRARGISNSCLGCAQRASSARPPAASSLWHILSKEINVPSARLIENRHCKCVVFCARLVSMRTRRLRVRKCRRAKNRRKPCEHHLLYTLCAAATHKDAAHAE